MPRPSSPRTEPSSDAVSEDAAEAVAAGALRAPRLPRNLGHDALVTPLPRISMGFDADRASSAPGERTSEAPERESLPGRMVRTSLAAMRAFVPAWRPRHRLRSAVLVLAAGAAVFILAWTAPRPVMDLYRRLAAHVPAASRLAALFPMRQPPEPAKLRLGRTSVVGNILSLPPRFASYDGSYDLVLHFHGNVGLVEESVPLSGVDAAVLIVNAGIGSSAYEARFSGPAVLPAVLDHIDEELQKRGLPHPQRRRVALTAWSAGWGAVSRILESNALGESLDAIIVLDGLHSAYGDKRSVDRIRLGPIAAFAERAKRDEKLLSITHSEIDPYTYPSTRQTADELLKMIGLERGPPGPRPELPALSQWHGIPREKLVTLEPTGETHVGSFHVRGYRGSTQEDHIAHLAYMATLALPELAKRWK
jgi:hypothetical protein